MIYIAGQSFGAIRVKNFKWALTSKDTWLGPTKPLKAGSIYDLLWDPGEQFDIAFNGAMPTHGNQTSPGRYSGSDNGWIGILVMPPLLQFFEELKTHPNLPYVPSGEGVTEIIPKELQ
jgi:arylsulfatase